MTQACLEFTVSELKALPLNTSYVGGRLWLFGGEGNVICVSSEALPPLPLF